MIDGEGFYILVGYDTKEKAEMIIRTRGYNDGKVIRLNPQEYNDIIDNHQDMCMCGNKMYDEGELSAGVCRECL